MSPPPLDRLADLHLLALQAANASRNTLALYGHVLALYRRWLTETAGKPAPTAEHLTPELLRRWAGWLVEGNRKPNTSRNYQRILKTHARWLVDEEILPADPLAKLRLPRERKSEPRVLSSDELARMLACCQDTLQPLRNKAVLALLADSGIRVSGLCGLDMADVTFTRGRQAEEREAGRVRIVLKGGDERSFPFGKKAATALQNYLALERDGPTDGAAPLFLGRAGQRANVKMVERVLRELTMKAGVYDKASNPHGLRHYAGTSWAAQGLNAMQIRDRLGHKDLTTSLLYCHLAQQDGNYRSALDDAEAITPRLLRPAKGTRRPTADDD